MSRQDNLTALGVLLPIALAFAGWMYAIDHGQLTLSDKMDAQAAQLGEIRTEIGAVDIRLQKLGERQDVDRQRISHLEGLVAH